MLRRAGFLLAVAVALAGCMTPPPAAPPPAAPPPAVPLPSSYGPSARGGSTAPSPAHSPGQVPRLDHVVLAVFENHGFDQVIGSTAAPYLNRLAAQGALMTDAHGVTHPSEPNYFALFSGSTHGVTDDGCGYRFPGPANLYSQLVAAGLTFTGYAEGMPGPGYRGCTDGGSYARKHAPWVSFTAVPAEVSRPFSDFPADFTRLPTVSFVVPDLCHDMHDCGVSTGDAWARAHLDGYARWAGTHNSLLIVTFDEDEGNGDGAADGGHIATILAGAQVAPGRYGEPVDHYGILRTVEAVLGLPGLEQAAARPPLAAIWR